MYISFDPADAFVLIYSKEIIRDVHKRLAAWIWGGVGYL